MIALRNSDLVVMDRHDTVHATGSGCVEELLYRDRTVCTVAQGLVYGRACGKCWLKGAPWSATYKVDASDLGEGSS